MKNQCLEHFWFFYMKLAWSLKTVSNYFFRKEFYNILMRGICLTFCLKLLQHRWKLVKYFDKILVVGFTGPKVPRMDQKWRILSFKSFKEWEHVFEISGRSCSVIKAQFKLPQTIVSVFWGGRTSCFLFLGPKPS